MKLLNIPTFQQGGTYIPPVTSWKPTASVADDAPAAARAAAAGDSKKDLTDKDILDMLKNLGGLPSDIMAITSELQNFYINGRGRRGATTYTAGTSSTAVRYLGALSKMKIAEFNKKEYDNAWEQVAKNGGLKEVAIDERGYYYCVNDKGDYKRLSAEELLKHQGEYRPLTNNELLDARAQDLSMANKNQVLNVVRNGIGLEEVIKQVQGIINQIGTTTTSQEGYMNTKQGRLIKGLQDFENAVQEASGQVDYNGTIDDLYKYKFLSKDQSQQAQQAMAFIYASLSKTAKSLLKSRTDFTDEGAKTFLQTLIAASIDNTQSFDIDLAGGKSAKTTKEAAAAGKDTTDLKASQLVDMIKSIDGVKTPMTIDRGDGIQMTVLGRQFNVLTEAGSNKPVTDTSLLNMLNQTGIAGIVKNMDNITFGDQKISRDALGSITYNSTGAIRVNLPTNPDGSVNLGLLDAYQKVEAAVDQIVASGRQPTAEEIQKLYQDYGLSSLLKANGQLDESKFGAFLVTEGYTTDALSGVQDSPFVKEYKGDTDRAVQLIKQSLAIGSGKDAQSPDVDTFSWWNPLDYFGNYDRIYKAAIYIPIDNNVLPAARLDGQKLDYDEAMTLEDKYQRFERMSQANSVDESVLGLNNN